MSRYLQRFEASSAQGAAGSVFVTLTSIYVESQIVLAGAELSKALSHRWRAGARHVAGSNPPPAPATDATG